MDYLWTPWRMNYIKSDKSSGGCVFCNALQHNDDVEMLIVGRGVYNFVILNRFPYNSGHLMVVPYVHRSSLNALTPETRWEMIEMVARAERVLDQVYHPQGFNMGINIGKSAGAGIDTHIHFHVVPRWEGDANFMSTLGQTRVLPEELPESYRRIRAAWDRDSEP